MASVSVRELPIFSLLSIAIGAAFVSGYEFQVGGERGWTKPTGNHTESYNFWASQHTFHVGDTLHFEYRNDDSVLEVNYIDYRDCFVSNPVSKFGNGSDAVFGLDRGGVFYFISGEAEHCAAGQKLVVRVTTAESETPEVAAAPSPESDEGSGDGEGWESLSWGPPSLNSTVKATLASYFATALGGFLVVLYLLS